MKSNQLIGYLLLVAGIAIIFYSLFSSINVFTGKTSTFEIFKTDTSKPSLTQKSGTLDSQIEKAIGEQLKTILPPDFLPKILNLTAFSILAGILIFGGVHISSLGIKMLGVKTETK